MWAVAFSIPATGDDEYQRIMIVEVHGRTGEVIVVHTDEELGFDIPPGG